MQKMVMVADQTVNEALRLGVSMPAVKQMVSLLQKYSIETIDVSLSHLKRQGDCLESLRLQSLFRCKIHFSLADIAEVRQRGFSRVIINWSHQPHQPSWERLADALAAAQAFAQEVHVCIDNAADFSVAELVCYAPLLNRYDVKRFIYDDQGSQKEPFGLCRELDMLQQAMPCPVEFHGHNGYGLATANSLAALRAGVQYVATAVSGIGVPNHAAMEEVLMAVKHLWKQAQVPSGSSLSTDCTQILAYMEMEVPVDKALIGRDVFAHESGIHVDGIVKNPLLYEVIQPEAVGQTRRVVVGKHSGTASLTMKFLQWNLELKPVEALHMLGEVRKIASLQKKSLSDWQLHQLYGRKYEMNPRQLG